MDDYRDRLEQMRLSRRGFLKRGAAFGAGVAAIGTLPALLEACSGSSTQSGAPAAGQATLNVLAPAAPDPAPVGVATYGAGAIAEFNKWQTDNKAKVVYEAIPWPQLHDKMATAFTSGNPPWDITYDCAWIPEFQKSLIEIGSMLSPDIKADLPPSSFGTTTIDGKIYGVVFSLSLLTLFYNQEHFQQAGLTEPPKTWDDLKRYVKELTHGDQYGWVLNYGAPEGIGGVASYWMTYLQQAGGKMYGSDGMPVFNDTPGVDALQLMLDLNTAGTDPGSISYVGINDATNVLMAGKASMMMNWPYMWVPAQDPKSSKIVGKLGSAILPAGSAGTASLDGTDAWTITTAAKNPKLAMQLIELYLDPVQQKSMCLDTGWLPIRLSVLNDPEVQKKAANAATVLEQANHPYDSFVTADYNQITQVIGTEIQKALKGQKTAAQAIKDSSDQVATIVKNRPAA
jgi:multiple sugar transport system substrate-binding protein